MTGFIYNNNSYDVGFGNTQIEYAGKGDSTLGYSMYGENIPEEPDKDKLLEWINIPQNTMRSYQGYGYYSVDIDYCINTEYYHEFRCSPKLGPKAATAYKDMMTFLAVRNVTSYPHSEFLTLNLRKNGNSYGNNYLQYLIRFLSSSYTSDIFLRYYNKNANTITYDTWNSIGIYKDKIVINDNKYSGSNEGGKNYTVTLNADSSTLFSYRYNNTGFEGKFSYFNVYEDDTKANLLHSYKPFLTPENEIIIKDVVTNKRFSFFSNSESGDMQYITYQIATN